MNKSCMFSEEMSCDIFALDESKDFFRGMQVRHKGDKNALGIIIALNEDKKKCFVLWSLISHNAQDIAFLNQKLAVALRLPSSFLGL
jgi:uncharacterized protein (UPF0303 family)